MAVKIYIVYYSMYGYIKRLAEELAEGANSVKGVEATLWQVPETLSTEELHKLGAPPKSHDVPIITPNDLSQADGFIFAFPIRFGMVAPQFKAFLNATEDTCKTLQLAGKPVAIITNTCSQDVQNQIPPHIINTLFHHGMIYFSLKFGIRYTCGQSDDNSVAEKIVTSPNTELLLSFHNGSCFASITKRLKEATA